MNNYNLAPTVQSGFELAPNDGIWSVILPEETTNLITNPSFELSFDGWSTPLTTIVAKRTNFRSRRGAWSAVISTDPNNVSDPANDHYIETTITGWSANQALTVSADGWTNSYSTADKANRIGILIDGVETLSQPLSQELTWERLSVTVAIPTGAAVITVRLYLGQAMSAPTDIILTTYWDGVQAELKSYATTYTDGDQRGLIGEIAPYRWLGLPHASKSKRSRATKSGGKITNFNDVDFRITAYTGAGFTGFDDISLDYALTEGEFYQRTIGTARTLTLTGFVCGTSQSDLQCNIHDLQRLLRPNVATQNGQFLLRYTSCECEGELDIIATYIGGAEGNYVSHWMQNFGIRLKAHQPFFIQNGVQGASLNWVQGHQGFLRIMRQNENGEWSQISNATIEALVTNNMYAIEWIGSDLFFAYSGFWQLDADDNETSWQAASVNYFIPRNIGGFYTLDEFNWGSVILTDNTLVYLVEAAGSSVDIGEWSNDRDGTYSVLAEDRFGNLFIGGTRGDVRQWDGTTYPLGAPSDTDSTWPLVVDDLIGTIKQIAFDTNNNMYICGDFTSPFGVDNTETISRNTQFQAKPTATPQTIGVFDFDGVLVAQTPGTPPTLEFCARVIRIPDGLAITTYTWWAEYDVLTTYTGECVEFTLAEPGGWTEPTVLIYLELTLDDGSTALKSYHYRPETDPDTGDIEYQSISSLDTNQVLETLKLDLKPDYCIDTIEDDVCEGETTTNSSGVDDDDPVISWLWENSLHATTSTDEEATFTLSPALGEVFTITLTSITDSGQSNQNVLTVEYINGELLTISETDNINSYTLTTTNPSWRPFNNFIYLLGGQWVDFGESVGITNDIAFDGEQVYLGGEYGVKKYDGGSLVDVGQITGTVIKLNFINGILYALTNSNVYRFNGTLWQPLGLSYPIGAQLTDMSVNDVGEVAVSANVDDDFMSSSATTEIVYNGTVEARPAFEIVGPGRLWYITNRTTDRTIYIDYRLQENEILTIELEQSNIFISSNLQGALSFQPGSRVDWYLENGSNFIELWMTQTNSDTSATMIRRLKYHSVDGLCCDLDDEDRHDYVPPALCCDNDPTLALQKVKAPYAPGCDTGFNVGSIWLDDSTGAVYIRKTA